MSFPTSRGFICDGNRSFREARTTFYQVSDFIGRSSTCGGHPATSGLDAAPFQSIFAQLTLRENGEEQWLGGRAWAQASIHLWMLVDFLSLESGT